MLIGSTEIIKRSWKLYSDNFDLVVKYALLGLIPGIVSFIFSFTFVSGAFLLTSLRSLSAFILFAVIGLAVFVGIVWLGALINFSLLKVMATRYAGGSVGTIGETFRSTRPVVWRGIGASFAAAFIPMIPLIIVLVVYAIVTFVFAVNGSEAMVSSGRSIRLLLGAAGIAAFVFALYQILKLAFTTYRTVLENETIGVALKNSKALVSGRWWSVLWRLFAPGFVFWFAIFVVSLILTALGDYGGTATRIILQIARLVLSTAVSPLFIIVAIIVYNELKREPPVPTTAP